MPFKVHLLSRTTLFSVKSVCFEIIFLQVWADEQSRLLAETSDVPVSLAGDGRCGMPRYCAKYLSYTFIDATRDVILHSELVQVRVIACFLLDLLLTMAY